MRWLSLKQPKVVLRSKVVGRILSHGLFDFIGPDNRYYSCSVVFDNHRIYGNIEEFDVLRLKSGTEVEQVVVEQSIYEVLDSSTISFSTKEEWVENRPKPVDDDLLAKWMGQKCQRIIDDIYGVSVGNFKVVEVKIITPFEFLVYFLWKEKPYAPLKMFVGEPTAVRFRNFLGETGFFKVFVDKIAKCMGGSVIWFDVPPIFNTSTPNIQLIE